MGDLYVGALPEAARDPAIARQPEAPERAILNRLDFAPVSRCSYRQAVVAVLLVLHLPFLQDCLSLADCVSLELYTEKRSKQDSSRLLLGGREVCQETRHTSCILQPQTRKSKESHPKGQLLINR